ARCKYTVFYICGNPNSSLISGLKDHTMYNTLKMMPKLLAISGALLFFLACGGEADPAKHFSIQLENKSLQQNQKVGVTLKNNKDLEISNLHYTMDGKELSLQDGALTVDVPTLGNKLLVAHFDLQGKPVEIQERIKVLAPFAPAVYTYEVVNTYPHDPSAYTQGLEFHKGVLYESTGKRGDSTVRKVDFQTGEILQKVDMAPSEFGEGITLMGDKLYLLTWQNGKGYVLKADNL